jgi:MOSC domain-containing protein YiiM
VQVGRAEDIEWLGRTMRTSIRKSPVVGSVEVLDHGLAGDEQADPAQHGGADKAIYAYAAEDYAWWGARLGRSVAHATFGENLTVTGLDLTNAVIGERWRVGTALLEVTEPRTPCWKVGMAMGDQLFPRAFCAARRPGVLLRVLQRGRLSAGDPVLVEDVPDHPVTAAMVFAMYLGDPVDVAAVLAAPALAAHWQEWVGHRTLWHLDEERKRAAEDARSR